MLQIKDINPIFVAYRRVTERQAKNISRTWCYFCAFLLIVFLGVCFSKR
jgi:hypothetical protein